MLGTEVPQTSAGVTTGHIFPNTASTLNATLNVDLQTKGVDAAGSSNAIVFARNNVEVATAYRVMGDTGVETQGATDADRTNTLTTGNGAVAGDTNNTYEIRDIILHIEGLKFKDNSYYEVMNRLVEGGNYHYHFKRYVLQTDTSNTNRTINYRLVVNSECLNYVLATFRPGGYDTLSQPVITQMSPTCFGHTGTADVSFENQIARGLPYTINPSNFICKKWTNNRSFRLESR